MSDVLDADSAAYAARLTRAGRPRALVLAFTAAARALRAQIRDESSYLALLASLPVRLTLYTLASLVARYVGLQTKTRPQPANAVASRFFGTVVSATHHAAQQLAHTPEAPAPNQPPPLERRAAVILQDHTQKLTMELTQRASVSASTLIRRTHSANPCAACDGLAGTYTAPFDPDLFYSHPRCACSITVT